MEMNSTIESLIECLKTSGFRFKMLNNTNYPYFNPPPNDLIDYVDSEEFMLIETNRIPILATIMSFLCPQEINYDAFFKNTRLAALMKVGYLSGSITKVYINEFKANYDYKNICNTSTLDDYSIETFYRDSFFPNNKFKKYADIEKQVIIHFRIRGRNKINVHHTSLSYKLERGYHSSYIKEIGGNTKYYYYGRDISFSLIFEGLPKDCKEFVVNTKLLNPYSSFHYEDIAKLKRNETDVYTVDF